MTGWALAWALGGPTIEWKASEGCPDQAKVVASVESYLGAAIDASSGANKRIAATASKQGDGWVARVEVNDGSGERVRTLPAAPSCAEAAEAAALVIAISIDPEAVERTQAAREEEIVPQPEPKTVVAPDTAPKKEVAPVIVPPEVAPPRVTPREPLDLRGAIGVHGGVEFGALPRVTGIVGASVSLLERRFRVFIDGNVLPLQRFAIGDARVDFRLWAVGAGGCPVFAVARQWSLAPCVAVEAGQAIGVRAVGFVSSGTARAIWVAARLIGRVQWRPHRLVGLHVAPELVVPFLRPRFSTGDEIRHESRAAGVRGTIGVEIQFP